MFASEVANILIVDDEKTILNLLDRALKSAGHSVETSRTVEDANAALVKQEFDLLIVDKNLPDGSGFDVTAAARKLGQSPETIVITGYSDTDSAIQAVVLGVYRYVPKPFDLEHLKIDINNALETRRLKLNLKKRTEEQEKSNIELQASLDRANNSERRLQQAERLAGIGYLAAGVAHEINNPLSVLSMTIPRIASEVETAQKLLNTDASPDTVTDRLKRTSNALNTAQEALDFLMRLSTDLHSLAKTKKQEHGPVNISEITGSALRLVRHQLKYKAKININIDNTLAVNGQPSRLMQVFINLLTNSARAIPNGNPEDNSVSITGTTKEDQAFIQIHDTGHGIPAKHLEQIFEPFVTFSKEDQEQGTGIGLAIVKEIIENHKGTIGVSSEQNVGTTFTIQIPKIQTPRASISVVPAKASDAPRDSFRLLIFDSKEANFSVYQNAFGSIHQVLFTSSEHEFEQLLKINHDSIDTVISELPSASGPLENLASSPEEFIRNWPGLADRCIFIDDPGKDIENARKAGHTVFENPVRLAILLGAIYTIGRREK
jgi:signal transduction histidine kinase